jgi:hypothetical protein
MRASTNWCTSTCAQPRIRQQWNGAARLSQALPYEFTGEAAQAGAIAAQWDQGIRAEFDGLEAYAEATAS